MKTKSKSVISCLMIILVVYSIFNFNLFTTASAQTVYFEFNGKRISPDINVEIAKTEGERQLGLMYRKSLKENSGMLFIFPDEAPRSFWMKNTYIALDIIFLNSKEEVVAIVENATPQTEISRESKLPAKYVLEVLAGKSTEWGIKPRMKLVMLNKNALSSRDIN